MDLLNGPLWSVMPQKAMLVSVVSTAAPGQDEAWDSCACMWSMTLPEALVMSSGLTTQGDNLTWVECVATLERVEVHGPEVMSGLVLTWARAILMSLASITTKVYGHVHSTLMLSLICWCSQAWESLAYRSSQVIGDGFWPGCRQKVTNCHPPPHQENWMWPCPVSMWTIQNGLFLSFLFSLSFPLLLFFVGGWGVTRDRGECGKNGRCLWLGSMM